MTLEEDTILKSLTAPASDIFFCSSTAKLVLSLVCTAPAKPIKGTKAKITSVSCHEKMNAMTSEETPMTITWVNVLRRVDVA